MAVAYDVMGSGPPIALVHGTPFSSFVWRAVARELARHYQLFVYDLLGYGQSEMRSGQDVSLGVQNRLLADLLKFWDLDSPNVIAHDFGGATALRAHLLNGREFRKLLLVDPVALSPWGSPFVQHVRRFEAAFAGVPAYIHSAILTAYVRGAAFKPLTAEALDGYVKPWTGEAGQAAFYRQIAQMDQRFTDEIEDSLDQVRCPCSLLWGADDGWIPVERGRELARRLGVERFVEIPQCGHLLQEDAPEAIVAAALMYFQ
jgi:pimeloyl-ACP methyl ester carboxylesterase